MCEDSIWEEGGVFYFYNEHNILYWALFDFSIDYFISYEYLNNYLYDFQFFPNGYDVEADKDFLIYKAGGKKVKKSIAFLIKRFFEINSDAILLYTYETKDFKGEKRKDKFNRWFTENSEINNLIKIDKVLEAYGKKMFISIMYKQENLHKEYIPLAIKESLMYYEEIKQE